eukprot:10324002-Lingulodinium_polyedra.AAC.1
MAEVELVRPPWRGEVPLVPDSNNSNNSNHSNHRNSSMNSNVGSANTDDTAYPTEARERQK